VTLAVAEGRKVQSQSVQRAASLRRCAGVFIVQGADTRCFGEAQAKLIVRRAKRSGKCVFPTMSTGFVKSISVQEGVGAGRKGLRGQWK